MRFIALLALISLPACTCVRADEVEVTACDTTADCPASTTCCADHLCRARCDGDAGKPNTEKSDGGPAPSDGGARDGGIGDAGLTDGGVLPDSGAPDAGPRGSENVRAVLTAAGHLTGGAFSADVQLGVTPTPQRASAGSLTLEGSAVLSP